MKGIQQLIMEPWYIQPEGITHWHMPAASNMVSFTGAI